MDDVLIQTPAGRLHGVLTRYNDAASSSFDRYHVWRTVWGEESTSNDDVVVYTSGAAGLLHATYVAARESRVEHAVSMFRQNVAHWSAPFFPPQGGWVAGTSTVTESAMTNLGMLAYLLARVTPRRKVPSDSERGDLIAQIDELYDQMLADESLPEQLRNLIRVRLEDIRNALGRWDVYGPDGVDQACAALLGTLSGLTDQGDGTILGRVREAAFRVWTAVGFIDVAYGGGQAIGAAVDWGTKMLGS